MRKSVALHRKSIIKESCFKTFKKFAKVFAFAISFESPLKALKLRKKELKIQIILLFCIVI